MPGPGGDDKATVEGAGAVRYFHTDRLGSYTETGTVTRSDRRGDSSCRLPPSARQPNDKGQVIQVDDRNNPNQTPPERKPEETDKAPE
jgi:hypothetical protein